MTRCLTLASLLCACTIPCRSSLAFQSLGGPSFQRTRARRYVKASRRSNRQPVHDYDDPFGDHDDSGFYESPTNDDDSGLYESPTNDFNNEEEEEKKSHFFSKKPLTEPTFMQNKSLFRNLCEGAGITRPSRIQSLAWPVLLEGKHAIIADQTGSGKTLAYLLPLLQTALKKQTSTKNKNGAPRLLVLAPTAELADQIHAVCAKLKQQVPFKTMVITATGGYNTNIRDQIRLLQRQEVDVMISTPGRIATILRTKNSGLDLTQLQSIVLDEVDVLMVDETFGPQLRTVGVAAPPLEQTQFVFCTATLPDDIVKTVQKEFTHVVQVRGPGLHRVAPTLKEHLVDVSVPSMYNRDTKLGFDIKAKELLKALRQHKCRRTLVFCNTVETCRFVENLLNRKLSKIYQVGAYHNAMTPQSRNRNLAMFSHVGKGRDSVLICTDRAARGVDFDASPVGHVVLFDFPRNAEEYVRRVGRTARAGRDGTTTVLAYGWQLPIARSVMGKKLTSFTSAFDKNDDNDEGDGHEEYKGRAQERKFKRQVKAEKERMIKGNIEGGRLWRDKK